MISQYLNAGYNIVLLFLAPHLELLYLCHNMQQKEVFFLLIFSNYFDADKTLLAIQLSLHLTLDSSDACENPVVFHH